MLRNRLWLFVVSGIGLALLAYWGFASTQPEEHVHYHAGFVVYVDGVKQDYGDFKYMNFKPCTQEEAKSTKEDEQIEKAHLHDGVGDVVHVEAAGSVWGDLFKNIGVTLPAEVAELEQPIVPDSSIAIVIGSAVDNPDKVSIERIKEVEAKSELCGSN